MTVKQRNYVLLCTLQSCIIFVTLRNPLSLWERESQAGYVHWPHQEKIHLPIVFKVFERFSFHSISDTHSSLNNIYWD